MSVAVTNQMHHSQCVQALRFLAILMLAAFAVQLQSRKVLQRIHSASFRARVAETFSSRRLLATYRLFVPSSALKDVVGASSIKLPLDEQQHVRSLRLKDGAAVELFDGSGRLVLGRLSDRGRSVNALQLLASEADPGAEASGRAAVSVVCLVGTPKSAQRADWMIEKLTELGVVAYRHVSSTRGEIDAAHVQKRALNRWHQVSIAAAKQSLRRTLLDVGGHHSNPGSGWLTGVCSEATIAFDHLVQWIESTASANQVFLLAAPAAMQTLMTWRADAFPLRTASASSMMPRRVVCIIGPEGGLTSDEEAALIGAGSIGVSLGPQRLRTETAAVAFAAALLTP